VENPPFDDEFDEFPRRTTRGFPIRTRLGSIRVSQQAPRILKDVPSPKKMDQLDLDGSGNLWFHFMMFQRSYESYCGWASEILKTS